MLKSLITLTHLIPARVRSRVVAVFAVIVLAALVYQGFEMAKHNLYKSRDVMTLLEMAVGTVRFQTYLKLVNAATAVVIGFMMYSLYRLALHLVLRRNMTEFQEIKTSLGELRAEKIKQDAEVKRLLKYYHSLFQDSGMASCVLDKQTGCIVEVNEEFVRVTGYSESDVVGMDLTRLVASDDRDKVGVYVRSFMSGQVAPKRFEADIYPRGCEKRLTAMFSVVVLNGHFIHVNFFLFGGRDVLGRYLQMLDVPHEKIQKAILMQKRDEEIDRQYVPSVHPGKEIVVKALRMKEIE